LKFEESQKRLEEIVARIESGQADLEEALTLYEEGIGLVRTLNARLEEAQAKLKELTPADEL